MPAFHIVVKLLMLRLLLANLSGLPCLAYDFGYHPSAEEFDSLLRETRSWTRDRLTKDQQQQHRESYKPRYRYPHELHKTETELNFQLFSDDHVDDQVPQEQQTFVFESVPALEQVQSQLIEITEHSTTTTTTTTKTPHSENNVSFPIFFTNPATGIVYAISEVGRNTKSQTWLGNDNDAIAIYVTKEQYDADLKSLRAKYEQQCPEKQSQVQTQSVLSSNLQQTPIQLTTARPQIIRLQKPKKTTVSNNKLPTHKPPPVMVTSSSSSSFISDQLKLPTSTPKPMRVGAHKTPKPKRGKRKKKKRKPGHKLGTSTAGPQFVLGKRTTNKSANLNANPMPATQLEKPHLRPEPTATVAGTIFNEEPFVVSSGYIELPQQQQQQQLRRRRSLDVGSTPVGARPISSGKPRPGGNSRRRPSSNGGKVNRPPATPTKPTGNQKKGGSGYRVPPAVHLLHSKHNGSEERSRNGEERPRSEERLRNIARRRSAEMDFDLFDLITGGDYDDDDSYYDPEEQQTIKLKGKRKKRPAGEKEKDQQEQNSSSAEEGADFGAMEEETSSNNSSSNSSTTTAIATLSSSVETSVEEEKEQEQDSNQSQSAEKQSNNKKRIKRRPTGADKNSNEYDYDEDDDVEQEPDVKDQEEEEDEDEEDDEDSDSAISSFFRMIFYPVQLAMSRLFDGFSSQSEEQSVQKPKYPSYTLYHSAHSHNGDEEQLEEEEEEEQEADDDRVNESNSLGSWFGYWFGNGRRTKKIGSTTAMPPPPPAPLATPAPEPAGWLESWFGFGKTTTQASSEEDDYDKWFSGWFDATPKPKARRRKTTTTTTSTTTTMPQMPILTIVDPLHNPQNWIGILAHHIVNATGGAATSTTTKNPLLQALVTRATSTTTPPPDVPRRISYDKYQIWRLKPQDETQVRALEEFKKGDDGNKMQWLKGPSLRGLTDVLVPPKMLVDFQGTLSFESIGHEVLIFDVGKAISYERTKEQYLYTTTRRPNKHPVTPPPMTWNKYYEHDDILKYLETMRMRHAQLVELIHIGRSYEGRPLIVVKIESKQTAAAATAAAASSYKRLKHKRRSGQANAVFIEAGSQGLAWIGPASATWMIGELLRLMRANKSDVEHEFIRNTTWYIMPVLNPDGYVYSHEYDRFWKKSRSQHVAKASGGLLDSAMTWLQQKRAKDKVCYGVDLDRNWLYHWGKRGSSKGPCNEFFAGPAPFSEPETKAVSEFLMDYRTQIKLYISLQAYGQVVSYPVKANSTFNVERMDDFLDVAMVGTDGLRKKGSKSRYKVDSANDLIEQRSGCADAFAAFEIGIPFSYTLQLADNGVHGYLLPSSAIEPTARDAFEIISGMLDYI